MKTFCNLLTVMMTKYCGYINITDIHIRNGYNDGLL